MGNTTKSPEDYDIVRNYRKEDWLKYEFGYRCELWKNKLTNQLVEVYQLPEMPSSKDLDRYSFRSKNTDLVTVYFVAHDNNETICTRSGEVQVLTEYIPIRLAEINYLDNAEGLTMLRTCFSGFNTITMFEPELEPNEEMIGLNEVGETKVWLNRNFSVNTPENVQTNLTNSRSRLKTGSHVRRLFQMIEERSNDPQALLPLRKIYQERNPGYAEAIAILEGFAGYYQINLKRKFGLVNFKRKGETPLHMQRKSHDHISELKRTQGRQHLRLATQICDGSDIPNQIFQNKGPILINRPIPSPVLTSKAEMQSRNAKSGWIIPQTSVISPTCHRPRMSLRRNQHTEQCNIHSNISPRLDIGKDFPDKAPEISSHNIILPIKNPKSESQFQQNQPKQQYYVFHPMPNKFECTKINKLGEYGEKNVKLQIKRVQMAKHSAMMQAKEKDMELERVVRNQRKQCPVEREVSLIDIISSDQIDTKKQIQKQNSLNKQGQSNHQKKFDNLDQYKVNKQFQPQQSTTQKTQLSCYKIAQPNVVINVNYHQAMPDAKTQTIKTTESNQCQKFIQQDSQQAKTSKLQFEATQIKQPAPESQPNQQCNSKTVQKTIQITQSDNIPNYPQPQLFNMSLLSDIPTTKVPIISQTKQKQANSNQSTSPQQPHQIDPKSQLCQPLPPGQQQKQIQPADFITMKLEDIENYIRKTYKSYINPVTSDPPITDLKATSKNPQKQLQCRPSIAKAILDQIIYDPLDVHFLQSSLDKKYQNRQSNQQPEQKPRSITTVEKIDSLSINEMLVDDSCNFSKGSQFREHGDILDTNTPNQADEDKLLEKYMNTFEAQRFKKQPKMVPYIINLKQTVNKKELWRSEDISKGESYKANKQSARLCDKINNKYNQYIKDKHTRDQNAKDKSMREKHMKDKKDKYDVESEKEIFETIDVCSPIRHCYEEADCRQSFFMSSVENIPEVRKGGSKQTFGSVQSRYPIRQQALPKVTYGQLRDILWN